MLHILKEKFEYKHDGFYNKKTGNRAGTINDIGYRKIKINNKIYSEHRLVWFWHNQYWPKMIDHVDRNKSNNNINNLREVTNTQNSWNKKVKGISKRGTKYNAQICCHGQKIWLGSFDSEKDAINARQKAELKYFGAYAPQIKSDDYV
jgi:hypothetical protein